MLVRPPSLQLRPSRSHRADCLPRTRQTSLLPSIRPSFSPQAAGRVHLCYLRDAFTAGRCVPPSPSPACLRTLPSLRTPILV
ncbi:hypothetical protein B0H10DRAFT_186243 [Mycena sp. CBHHK59/15]|nr:hypothetical protein B0H10DRAFT_186243 [Mycena sp. CBHHK59/15]